MDADPLNAAVLAAVLAAVFFYVLYAVIRAATRDGIIAAKRQAVDDRPAGNTAGSGSRPQIAENVQ